MWCTECCSFLIQSSQSPPCNSPQHWIFSTQKDCGIHFPWFAYLAKEQQSPLCSWKIHLKNWCEFGLLHTQALKVHPWCTTSPLPIAIESSANLQRSSMPWHAWKEKNSSMLHDIMHLSLINSINKWSKHDPPRHDFL